MTKVLRLKKGKIKVSHEFGKFAELKHIDKAQVLVFNKAWMKFPRLILSTLAQLSIFGSVCSATESASVYQTENPLIPQGLITLSDQSPLAQHAFVVDKSTRQLFVYHADGNSMKLIATHPTDIGKNQGEKTRRNDHRTPVGIYFLREQKTQPEIPFDLYGNLAFTTDYPNVFDKREAKTGDGIWLHAVPDTIPLTRGSRGCVVVRNDVIKALRPWVNLGQTPLLIFDKVNYLSLEEHSKQRDAFLKEFENWRKAWESHNVEEYIKYYDDTFRNDEMNFRQWYRHKKNLTTNYAFIKVNLGPPLVLQNKDQVVLRFTQRYQSDKHSDFGEKTIHGRWVAGGSFRIIREEWRRLAEPKIEISAETKPAASNN
jgi:murein L,D-transpeptidase YafK